MASENDFDILRKKYDEEIAKEAGTYLIHVELGANAIANFIADQTIVAFTVSVAA